MTNITSTPNKKVAFAAIQACPSQIGSHFAQFWPCVVLLINSNPRSAQSVDLFVRIVTWNPLLKLWTLSPYISTNDMKTITPADNPKEVASVTGLARRTNLLKKITSPPIHVDNPAAIVKPNASPTWLPVCTMIMVKKNNTDDKKTNLTTGYVVFL